MTSVIMCVQKRVRKAALKEIRSHLLTTELRMKNEIKSLCKTAIRRNFFFFLAFSTAICRENLIILCESLSLYCC